MTRAHAHVRTHNTRAHKLNNIATVTSLVRHVLVLLEDVLISLDSGLAAPLRSRSLWVQVHSPGTRNHNMTLLFVGINEKGMNKMYTVLRVIYSS
jgi:hypothetical protein